MSDNITLPRKHIDYAAHALEHFNKDAPDPLVSEIIHHLRAALAAEQPKHPGYVIGSHWLETAYSRVCAGEAEADVLRDCGWERVDDAEALRRENERLREALESIAKTDLRGVSLLAAGSVLLKVVDKAKAALRREET